MSNTLHPTPPDDWERIQIGLAYLNRAHSSYMDKDFKSAVRELDSCSRALGPLSQHPDSPVWMELGINLPLEVKRLAHAIRQRTQRKAVVPQQVEGPPWAWDSFSPREQAYLKFHQWRFQQGLLSEH